MKNGKWGSEKNKDNKTVLITKIYQEFHSFYSSILDDLSITMQ